MPFSDTEFQSLLSGLKAVPDGAANEAPLAIYMESPIYRKIEALSGIDSDALRDACDRLKLGFPRVTLEVNDQLRRQINSAFRHVERRVAHSHVFGVANLTLSCSCRVWTDDRTTLGTFTEDQAERFAAAVADKFREAAVLKYGPSVLRAAPQASAPSVAPRRPALPGSLEYEVASLIQDGHVIRLPSVQLEHYPTIKKLLTNAGGKYGRNAFTFSSPQSASTALEAASGGRDLRKETQFFRTRDDVVEIALSFFDHRELRGTRALEPSAGDGAMADQLRDCGVSEVVTIENWPERASILKTKGYPVIERDFLSVTPDDTGLFDVVLMNPPFSGGQDIAHVSHALQFLAPQGKLSAIMPANAGMRRDKKSQAFARLLALLDDPVTQLPAGSFAEAGTNVATINVHISMEELLRRVRKANIDPASLGLDLTRQMAELVPAPAVEATPQAPARRMRVA